MESESFEVLHPALGAGVAGDDEFEGAVSSEGAELAVGDHCVGHDGIGLADGCKGLVDGDQDLIAVGAFRDDACLEQVVFAGFFEGHAELGENGGDRDAAVSLGSLGVAVGDGDVLVRVVGQVSRLQC